MAVPDFQTLLLPVLQFAGEIKHEFSTSDACAAIAKRLNLTDEDLRETIPSGMESTLANRISWATTYMKKALLLESTRRGFCQITARGIEILDSSPKRIDIKFLSQFQEFRDFQNLKGTRRGEKENGKQGEVNNTLETPLEALENASDNLRSALADELLGKLKKVSPAYFERVVVDLLVKMGYGGSRADAGKAIGKSGDGGIDGIIKEDRLGLDVVYIQAKRWDNNPVGRPDVMQFAGALQAQKASKGIFITTSRFTEDARSYVSKIGSKIVLIDGNELTELMIDHEVGVTIVTNYPVKKIDTDYFDEGV